MSDDHIFKPGDVVQLKSGGPVMTVSGKHAFTDGVICKWFDGKKPAEDVFSAELLARYEAPRRRVISVAL